MIGMTKPIKKNGGFAELLSIPRTSKPFSEKKTEDSEPTKPQDPVIKTKDIDLISNL